MFRELWDMETPAEKWMCLAFVCTIVYALTTILTIEDFRLWLKITVL